MKMRQVIAAALSSALLFGWGADVLAAETAEREFGRLFHTPQKRSILDSLRGRDAPIDMSEQLDSLRVDGIVRRSGGPSTVWINGRAHHDRAPVQRMGNSSVHVFTGDKQSVEVRVGETVTLTPTAKGAP